VIFALHSTDLFCIKHCYGHHAQDLKHVAVGSEEQEEWMELEE